MLAADLDSIPDFEWLLAAEVTGRDHLLAAAELVAIVDASHRGSGRYVGESIFAPADDSSRAHRSGRIKLDDVEEIIDRLYALPLEEFTRERNEAERELRKAGQAEQVKAVRKPTAAAAATNQLVHARRAQVEAFLQAAATLRDAQVAGKGDLATAAEAEQEGLEKLVSLSGETVRPTLQAAAVDDNTARDLLEARLVREREPEPAGFGTLLAHAHPHPVTAPPDPTRRAAPAPTGWRANRQRRKQRRRGTAKTSSRRRMTGRPAGDYRRQSGC